MPAVTRVGDRCTGHDDCPPVPLQTGSANVFINGKPVGRVGDPYEIHSCPVHDPHVPYLAAGAANVFINGISVSRVGDAVDCGGVVMEGSGNVFVGDGGGGGRSGSGNDGGSGTEGTGSSSGGSGSGNSGTGSTDSGNSGGGTETGGSEAGGNTGSETAGTGVSIPAMNDSMLAESIAANLAVLQGQVDFRGTDTDKLIMCLPEIAAAEAERQDNEEDRQGWLYLHDMFERWLGGKANDDAEKNPNVFWVDFDWILSFDRANEKINSILQTDYLFNQKARDELVKVLKQDGKFTDKIEEFDNTLSTYTLKELKKYSHQYVIAKDDYPYGDLDGLFAALGNFSIMAVTKGFVVPLGNDRYEIKIEKVGLFIYDKFNFSGNQSLGYWNCKDLVVKKIDIGQGKILSNSSFRKFRNDYGSGCDFLVGSRPKIYDYGFDMTIILK